VQSSTSLPLST